MFHWILQYYFTLNFAQHNKFIVLWISHTYQTERKTEYKNCRFVRNIIYALVGCSTSRLTTLHNPLWGYKWANESLLHSQPTIHSPDVSPTLTATSSPSLKRKSLFHIPICILIINNILIYLRMAIFWQLVVRSWHEL